MAKTIRTRHDRRAARDESAPDTNAVRSDALHGFAELLWMQVEPDPLNPRKDFDSDEAQAALEELAASIERDGLLENLVVRVAEPPNGYVAIKRGDEVLPFHRLVAGERRWRAIGRLIEQGKWSQDRPIPCRVVDLDEAGHRRVALVENLQRRDLKPLEEARALQALAELTGASAAQLGRDLGFTERWAQQRLALLKLPEKIQAQVEDGRLKIEQAREAGSLFPRLPAIKKVELEAGKITLAEAKAWLDAQPKAPELTPAQWVMALEILDAIERRPMKRATYEYERTEVGQGALKDGHLEQIANRGLFSGPDKHRDNTIYEETGRLLVSLKWKSRDLFELQFGAGFREGCAAKLAEVLPKARAAANIEAPPEGRYSTPWLNEPFEVPAPVAARYAAKLEAHKKSKAGEKAAKKAEAEAKVRRKAAAAANADAIDAIVRELAGRPPGAAHPRFAELLAAVGLPAPWRVEHRGRLVAANGAEVLYASWQLEDRPEILQQRVLFAAAVNVAAGVAFAVEPEQPTTSEVETDDEDDQVDLEEAIEAGAEDEAEGLELTPALRRLAGGAAK